MTPQVRLYCVRALLLTTVTTLPERKHSAIASCATGVGSELSTAAGSSAWNCWRSWSASVARPARQMSLSPWFLLPMSVGGLVQRLPNRAGWPWSVITGSTPLVVPSHSQPSSFLPDLGSGSHHGLQSVRTWQRQRLSTGVETIHQDRLERCITAEPDKTPFNQARSLIHRI